MKSIKMKSISDTRDEKYSEYLNQHQGSILNQVLQTPYRMHIQKLKLGKTLDIGCGAGRNLRDLPPGSLGIDHSESLVRACLARGLSAVTTEQFKNENLARLNFDSILLSHVAEHMTESEFSEMLGSFLKYLTPGGRVVVICPQELGYASDSTHVEFMDFEKIAAVLKRQGLNVIRSYSFPFPRRFGRFFRHNETVVIGKK